MKDRVITMKKEGFGANVFILGHRCYRCEHAWMPRVNMEELKNKVKAEPMICPNCKTPYWRTKRKNKKNKEKKK